MPQNEDPFANGLFWLGIILGSGMLALRLAGIFWSLFLHIWQVFALLGATALSFCCFGAALNGLRYAPMRTDVDLDDLFNPKYVGEHDYAIKSEDAFPAKSPEKESKPEPEPQESPFNVHIDHEAKQKHLLDVPVHSAKKLNEPDKSFLLRNDYEEREFVPLGKIRRENFLIKRQSPKSLEHTFLLHAIYDKLSEYSIDVEITRDQDIAILRKRQNYALCVVTPDDLRKHNCLSKKASRLTSICCGNWWFVVTQSAYAKSFQRYGDVLTRNQLDEWIRTTFSPPPLNATQSHHTQQRACTR
jgi:hypothetical protein